MARLSVYPFFAVLFCSFQSFSGEISEDYESSYNESSNEDYESSYNEISDSEMEELSDSDKENHFEETLEEDLYYKITYTLSAYSDNKYDDSYALPIKFSNKKWARYEKEHIEDWIENLRELRNSTRSPSPKQLHNCFLNTRHVDKLYRPPHLNKQTGNKYYPRRDLTPTKSPCRKGNPERIQKGKTPVWVPRSTGRITSYCFHHLSQSNENEIIVMMPQEVHWEYSKLFHQRNDKSTVDRNDFGKEKPKVLKEIYLK